MGLFLWNTWALKKFNTHGMDGVSTDNYLSLLFLMAVFSQTLLALVGGHFVFLSFFTTWHNAFLVLPRHVGAGLTIHLF
jgi:hypothetical protein